MILYEVLIKFTVEEMHLVRNANEVPIMQLSPPE